MVVVGVEFMALEMVGHGGVRRNGDELRLLDWV